MFKQFAKSPRNLAEYVNGPFAAERSQFLAHLQRQGHSYGRLQVMNRTLLTISRRVDIKAQSPIGREMLEVAAERWLKQRSKSTTAARHLRTAKTDFISIASNWLRFLGCYRETISEKPFAEKVAEFVNHLREEIGVSEETISCRIQGVEPFLAWLKQRGSSIDDVSPRTITEYFLANAGHGWKRSTVVAYVQSLRTFFRFAAVRGWCREDLALTIDRPRIYTGESLPQGPKWEDVLRLIARLDVDEPTKIRDRAIILLLAVYGLRAGEVCGITLDDLDWDRERIWIHRPKQRKKQEYPLAREVGEAILKYLKRIRPHSSFRELFLRLKSPHRPMTRGGLGCSISIHIRKLGLQLPHYGAHTLRHACATHLLAEGFSIKEIGDHLGHRSAAATRIYAKVDDHSLRKVCDLDFSDLLQVIAIPLSTSAIHSDSRMRALREVANFTFGGLL